MENILKRTAYMEVNKTADGYTFWRPLDWARVETTLGSMIEPFLFNQRYGIQTAGDNPADTAGHDYEEDLCMVNEMVIVDSDKQATIFSDYPTNGISLIGGRLIPRKGR